MVVVINWFLRPNRSPVGAGKTEVILLTGRRIAKEIRIIVGTTMIETKKSIRYPGVDIDN